jgi:penicillin-insensitive murein DD-endopeptidase
MTSVIQKTIRIGFAVILGFSSATAAVAQDATPAKQLFGAMKLPSVSAPAASGFYSKGCITGAIAIPVDGSAWQVKR